MDFTLQGSPSPRTTYRHLAGNGAASRPSSGKPQSRRNPITGEEIHFEAPVSARQDYSVRPNSRPDNVPSLDLKYLKETDKAQGMPLEIYDYSLNTPGTASTLSSHTARSHYNTRVPSGQSKSCRPADVPALCMVGDGDNVQPRKLSARTKQPTAWDNAPVPGDLAAQPSNKHREMYKQYQDEMKQSYKQYSEANMGKSQVTEEDVMKAVEAVKKTYTKSDSPDLGEDEADSSGEDDHLQLSYTNKSYASLNDTKKMDATEFEEYKRKQQLIETVMIDQLSRAVISAPEQNARPAPRSHRPGMPRGTNRSLHDSKVSTNTTATENLLQRRVRFGARLLTRNGHDAIRELTGFFFHVDNSLTIYEFKQFGKSAKALPFIPRGQYSHVRGRRVEEQYTLTDIYPGGNLEFSTRGLHALPDSMKTHKVAVFRVTDVDDEEKSKIILAGVKPSEREKAYARLHMPHSKGELEDRVLMLEIQTYVRKLLRKRGVRTIMGLGHHLRKLDRNNTGLLPRFELEKALLHYHIDLGEGILASLLAILDEEGSGYLDYCEFLRTVLGEMNEYRKSFVSRAFRKIDAGKQGVVSFSDLKKFYNAAKHPKVKSGQCSEMTILKSFLDSFQYCEKTEEVTFMSFEEYYEGLSVGLENDDDFVNILKNSWNL